MAEGHVLCLNIHSDTNSLACDKASCDAVSLDVAGNCDAGKGQRSFLQRPCSEMKSWRLQDDIYTCMYISHVSILAIDIVASSERRLSPPCAAFMLRTESTGHDSLVRRLSSNPVSQQSS